MIGTQRGCIIRFFYDDDLIGDATDLNSITFGETKANISGSSTSNRAFNPSTTSFLVADTNNGDVRVFNSETGAFVRILQWSPDNLGIPTDLVFKPAPVEPPGPTVESSASFAASGTDADPVNTFTGELFTEDITDIDLGGPMPLRFTRYYASYLRRSFILGDLGSNWLHNFETRLHRSGTTMTYVSNAGRVVKFLQDTGTGEWEQTSNLDRPYQLIAEGTGDAGLYAPDGDRIFTFDFSTNDQLAGKLIKI